VLDRLGAPPAETLEAVLAHDAAARELATRRTGAAAA